MPAARTTVSKLAAAEGELSFTVAGPFGEHRVRFWGDVPETPAPMVEPALAAALLPAMAGGGELSLPEPPSPQLSRALPELQGALQSIGIASRYCDRPLEVVAVSGRAERGGDPSTGGAPGRVGAFFSGGVDSWTTLLLNPEVTDLIHMQGFDIALDRREAAARVEEVVRGVAERRGLRLHVVGTDLRALLDPVIAWEVAHGPTLASMALVFAPLFERIVIASGVTFTEPVTRGSHPLVDPLWSTDSCRIEHHGAYLTRAAKVELLADSPEALETLRVCWERVDEYNCGRCEKCLRTMAALEAVGALERCPTFRVPLDLDAVAGLRLDAEKLTWWAENHRLAQRGGSPELVEALEICLSASERRIAEEDDAELRLQLAEANAQVEGLSRQLAAVLSSRSWRLTAPARRAGGAVRRLGRGRR